MSVCVICADGASLAIYKNKVQINRISTDESLIGRGKIAEAYNGALAKLKKEKNARMNGIFLLPQNMYCVDYAVIPSVGAAGSKEFLRVKLKADHKNYDDLAVNFWRIKSERNNSTYRIILVRKSLLKEIKSAFLNIGIKITAFIPFGAAAIEGAALMRPDIKNEACILFMSDGEREILIEAENEALIGDGRFYCDAETLSGETALSENDLETEKFRLSERRILTAARELKYGENAVDITSVYLYLPPKCNRLAEATSAENPPIKWINLNGIDGGGKFDVNFPALDGAAVLKKSGRNVCFALRRGMRARR